MKAVLFFTVFLDLLGLSLVIPILAPLFITSDIIFPAEVSFAFRTVMLGVLMAAYPAAQFFGAPVLGALSDRYGRKPVLTASLLGSMVGYIIFAFGIYAGSIWLLLASRLLDGFTGGNISIVISSIADISNPKTKTRDFGLIGTAFGLGFIIGPFIGGKLSDASLASWFGYATPFWFAAALSLINIFLLTFRYQETLQHRTSTPVTLFSGLANIASGFKMQNLRNIYLVIFLAVLGFNFHTQFFQVYLIQKFAYDSSSIGNFFAYLGLWVVLTQGFLIRPFSRWLSPEMMLRIFLPVMSLSISFLVIPDSSWLLYLIVPFVAISQGFFFPSSETIVSNIASSKTQGRLLGISQSMRSLAMTLPPLLAGLLTVQNIRLPTYVSAATIILAWILYLKTGKSSYGQSSKSIRI